MNATIAEAMGIALLSFIHSAAVADASGIPLQIFTNVLCEDLAETLQAQWKETAGNWSTGNLDPLQCGTAKADMWWYEMRHLFNTANDVRVKTEFLQSVMHVFERVKRSGKGNNDISVIFDLLKDETQNT